MTAFKVSRIANQETLTGSTQHFDKQHQIEVTLAREGVCDPFS